MYGIGGGGGICSFGTNSVRFHASLHFTSSFAVFISSCYEHQHFESIADGPFEAIISRLDKKTARNKGQCRAPGYNNAPALPLDTMQCETGRHLPGD